MARYETPPDPRDSELRASRPRRQRDDRRDWIPLIGLFTGLLVTFAAIFIAWQLVQRALATEPIYGDPVATVIVLTAPASPTPTPLPSEATPTPSPPPGATPDNSLAPDDISVNYYAQVINTGGVGVTVRGGPSTDNVRLLVVQETNVVLVIDGPAEGSGFTWWQVRIDDGTEGWIAADFLAPADKPETGG